MGNLTILHTSHMLKKIESCMVECGRLKWDTIYSQSYIVVIPVF